MKFKSTVLKVLALASLVGSASAPAWSVPVDEYFAADDGAYRAAASVTDTEKPLNAEYVNSRAQAMSSPSNGPAFRAQNFK